MGCYCGTVHQRKLPYPSKKKMYSFMYRNMSDNLFVWLFHRKTDPALLSHRKRQRDYPGRKDFRYRKYSVLRWRQLSLSMVRPYDFTYTTKKEGPLYLKMNIPKKIEAKPDGTMEIKIYGGIPMPLEEIYKKIGWREDDVNNSVKMQFGKKNI